MVQPTRSAFFPLTALSLLLSTLLCAAPAMAMSDSDEVTWITHLVATNNGKAFCLPPGVKFVAIADVIDRYVTAHPEWKGKVDDDRIVTALTASFACPPAAKEAPTPVKPVTGDSVSIEVPAHSEYANIDTHLAADTIRLLQGTSGSDSDVLIATIEKNSGDYAPPVLFALSRVLYKRGKADEAIFWFNAGRLRGNFDAARCADDSAKSAIPALVAQIPVELRQSQFNDLDKLKDIIHRVVQWDETTPYHYDQRWINLHGIAAITSRANGPDGANDAHASTPEMSLPQDQWPELAKKVRDDYLDSLDKAIEIVSKQRATK